MSRFWTLGPRRRISTTHQAWATTLCGATRRSGSTKSTPLGSVLSTGGEIWLPSLSDAGTRYPLLLDAIEAGLASTASLVLRDQHQSLIGAMGVAWTRAQAFTDAQKDEVRVVAQLAGTLSRGLSWWRLSGRPGSAPSVCSG